MDGIELQVAGIHLNQKLLYHFISPLNHCFIWSRNRHSDCEYKRFFFQRACS